MTQTFTVQHLPPEVIEGLVARLPDYIKTALLEKSAELECSMEATVEQFQAAHSPTSVIGGS